MGLRQGRQGKLHTLFWREVGGQAAVAAMSARGIKEQRLMDAGRQAEAGEQVSQVGEVLLPPPLALRW